METKPTILIVEDDEGLGELLSERLQECDYDTVCASSGSKAIGWLKNNSPFLILLDYSLLDMNGKEFIFELANNNIQLPPFVVSTGQGDERIAVEMMKLGALDYIIKDANFLDMIPIVVSKVGKEINNDKKLRKVERELSESNQFNRQIIQSAQEGIVVYDLNMRIQVWNPFMERLTGFSTADVTGKSASDVFPFFATTLVIDNIRKAFDGEVNLDLDVPFDFFPTGKSGWASASLAPFFSATGEIIGAISTIRDISDRKSEELELVAAKEKAEESDRLKSSFLNNVSHEFRTPMNAIMGFSSMLVSNTSDIYQRQSFADIIQTACNQLLDIVTNVVEISEIQANQIKLIEKEANLQLIFEDVIEDYAEDAFKKGLDFVFEVNLKDDQYKTIIDSYKLTKVLKHLISNAIKFTYAGKIKIECGLLDSNQYIFSVCDSGIGISEEMQHKVFEPFRQVELGPTRKYGGPGIGLSIAKSYVDIMGGEISLQSQINVGTTITFKLPHKTTDLYSQLLGNSLLNIDLSSKTVLIAEDEMVNYVLLEELLAKTNVNILHAKNGIEAIDFCRNNAAIDLVLMDIKMPRLDGYTAAKQIKIFRPELQIVAQTAYELQQEKEGFNEATFVECLAKPISRTALVETLRKYIDFRPNTVL